MKRQCVRETSPHMEFSMRSRLKKTSKFFQNRQCYFQSVCKSEHTLKYLLFCAPTSSVDDLSSLSIPNLEKMLSRSSFSFSLVDRQTNSKLFARREENDNDWVVVMGKLDGDGRPSWRHRKLKLK